MSCTVDIHSLMRILQGLLVEDSLAFLYFSCLGEYDCLFCFLLSIIGYYVFMFV